MVKKTCHACQFCQSASQPTCLLLTYKCWPFSIQI